MDYSGQLEEVLALLRDDRTADALAKLLGVPKDGYPRRELYRAICLSGLGYAVSAILVCDQGLAEPTYSSEYDAFNSLRQSLLAQAAKTTKENWAQVGEPKISIVVDARARSWRDFTQTFRSIEVQQYGSLEIVVMGAGSVAEQQELRSLYPQLRFLFALANDSDQLSSIRCATASASGDIISFVHIPVIYPAAAIRCIAEIARASADVTWFTGQRFFVTPNLVMKWRKVSTVLWSEEFFLDRSRFRYPRADLEFENTIFRKDFLSERLNSMPDGTAPSMTTKLLAQCFKNSPPHQITADLAGRISIDDSEPNDELSELANKTATLISLGRGYTPSTSSHPSLRLRLSDEAPITIPQLSQLPKVSVTGALPKISLVVPNFNQAQLLRECLDSVVAQKYPRLELIVQDGASTDGSCAVLEEFRPYITILQSKSDAGHYHAVNEGLTRATGEIFGWINSTDLLTPWSLHTAAAIFMTRPDVEWLTGKVAIMTASGALQESREAITTCRDFLLEGKFDDPWIQQEGTFFRASLWKEAGGSLDLSFSLAGDLELWSRFFRFAPLHTTTAALGIFRYHDGQRSEQGRHLYYQEALEIIERERSLVFRNQNAPIAPACPNTLIASVQPLLTAESANIHQRVCRDQSSLDFSSSCLQTASSKRVLEFKDLSTGESLRR